MKSISLKQFAVALFAVSTVTVAPVFALSTAEVESLGKSVAITKVVELPAVTAKMVKDASKEDKEQVAVAVVISAIRNHPSSIANVITSVVKAAPQTTAAVVKAALEVAPDSSLTIVAAAAEGAPDEADKAVAVASRKMPSRTASFEREVAVVRGRRLISSAAQFGDSGSSQTPRPPGSQAPAIVQAYAGGDPGRP